MLLPIAVIYLLTLNLSIAHGAIDKQKPIPVGDHGDPKFDQILADTAKEPDAKELREMIQKTTKVKDPTRQKSPEIVADVSLLKESLLKSTKTTRLSNNLTEMLKEPSSKANDMNALAPILGMEASEAIAHPNINVIDSHITQFINANVSTDESSHLDLDEVKESAQRKHLDSNLHNLFRENLQIDLLIEESRFMLGNDVEEWKVLNAGDKTALIGKTINSIILALGHNDSYQQVKTLQFDVPSTSSMHFEVLRVWDSNKNHVRSFVVVALQGELIWHEIVGEDLLEIHRWNLLKEIDAMLHFKHDGSEILLISTIDESGKVQAEFIEFIAPDSEFWVIQAFKLTSRSSSMTCLDLGKDFTVAFVQDSRVVIYRHQYTKHSRGKFSLFKTIDVPNVSTISGFRVGGHSYLAIGGDQPQILRYINGDFHQQTILSQSFGHVEIFLPIPIRTYRDDLVLLVQHRLDLGTHTIAVVDALVWNGIAFENALSVPCRVSADPNANGFTCMLDPERDSGLKGAAFVHHQKENGLFVVIPRQDAHSGLFRLNYSIVDAEDPLMKEIEQVRKSIELINQMLEFEETVKKEAEEALKVAVNPKNDFEFENLQWIDEIQTNVLEFDGNIELESDVIEFADSTWTHEDFLVNLDNLEATIAADEAKLKMINDELNKVNRINRQTPSRQSQHPQDSPIHHLGVFPVNGQFDTKTLRVLPQNRPRRQVEPINKSQVPSLTVKNIDVKNINRIPVSELMFLEDGHLMVPDGNVTFMETIQVENVIMVDDGRVNGIDFSHEVLAVESPNPAKNLIFEDIVTQSLTVSTLNGVPVHSDALQDIDFPTDHQNLTAKSIFIGNDLKVETINGIPWNDFVAKLVPKHIASSAKDIEVDGDVYIVGDMGQLNAAFLNSLPFPDGYVLKDGPRETIITGKKIFSGELLTQQIDTDGTIDGLEPTNMITLDQTQRISTKTTFNVLEVMKKLEVNGTIAGKQLNEFLPNPTLEESNEVLAAVSFRELVVEGTVTIEDSLNDVNLESILADVVYETNDDSEVVISAQKTFGSLEMKGEMSIKNNFVNDQSLDDILTVDRDHTVNFERLQGDVFFSNLKMSGLFDGVNATELEHNSIRTFGDQFIETPLIIAKGHRVEAAKTDVKESLNGISVADYLFIDTPINLRNAEVIFNELQVENLKLKGNLEGPGTLTSLNITDLTTNYLSKSRKQTIVAPASIKSLTTEGIFHATTINDMDFEKFRKYMRGIKNFKSLILSGDQKLDNLIIDGSVKVTSINDKDFNQIVENVIWLNRPNTIEGNLKFIDEVTMNGPLNVQGTVNKKSFELWKDNWISNTETTIVIDSDKIFTSDVIIEESVKVDSINSIKFEDLLTVKDVVNIPNLIINGNVITGKLKVHETFNQQSMKHLDSYSYDASSDTHQLNTDVHFNQQSSIAYLNTPVLNQLNVTQWMDNFIRLNENNVFIKSPKVFANQFIAQQGFHADAINDINLEFLNYIVLTNEPSMVTIDGDIVFADEVYAQLIALKGDLYTRYIANCDPQEWLRYSLPINRTLLLNGVLRIKASALKPSIFTGEYLNGVAINDLLTLHTNQTFNHHVKVGTVAVREPLIVRDSVNGLKLANERENTVMRYEQHQVITMKTSFPGARVYGPLTAHAKVNSKYLKRAVLLNSSPTIESSVNFKNLQASSLFTNTMISGVAFDKWYDNVLWSRGKDEQTVSSHWKVKKLQLIDDATGNGLINDMSISDIERNLRSSIASIDTVISNHTRQYQELCKELSAKANESQNSIHILKHLELDFKLHEEDIFSYFAFETPERNNYFAINTNCTTQLYKWKKDEKKFKKQEQIVTGVVYDWAMVKNVKSDVFIVTNSRMEANYPCAFGGLNVWKLNGDQMFHVNTISNKTDVLELHVNDQQPGRFFTLNNLDLVEHFDVFGGDRKEFWQLPSTEHYNYSFIPSDVISELTLFNGRKLFMLESKFKKRQARFSFEDRPLRKLMKPETRPVDSPVYTIANLSEPRGNSLPSIPATSLRDSDKQDDFITRIRQVGDAVRNSMRDNFNNVPKLTIKSANAQSATVRNDEEATSTVSPKSEKVETPNVDDMKADLNKFFEKVKVDGEEDEKNLSGPEPNIDTHSKPDFGESTTTTKPTDDATGDDESADVTRGDGVKIEEIDNTETKEATESPNVGGIINDMKQAAEKIKNVFEPHHDHKTTTNKPDDRAKEPQEHIISNATGKVTLLPKIIYPDKWIYHGRNESRDLFPKGMGEGGFVDTMSKFGQGVKTFFTVKEGNPLNETVGETEVAEAPQEPINEVENKTLDESKLNETITFPRIILPIEDDPELENADDIDRTTIFPETPRDENGEEFNNEQVPVEVLSGSGVRHTENSYIPERGNGEFVMMYVGPRYQKRALYAVTSTRASTIKGNHNVIEIYNDIFVGNHYQSIYCTDPSNLVALQFRDETLFAFLESRSEILVYSYRGVQGFVNFRRIKLPGYAVKMTTLLLPPSINYKCDHHYLVVQLESEIIFYRVEISGNCGLSEVHCD